MMTGKEALLMIDKEALLTTAEGLEVGVKVLNVRTVWGRTDFEVSPLIGNGKTWVSSQRIKVRPS